MAKGSFHHRKQRERDVRDFLNAHGWVASRTAQEIMDVIACANGRVSWHPGMVVGDVGWHVERAVLYVQVKTTIDGPFATFGPKDRTKLREAARKAGASVWLAWWPPRAKGPVWIPEADWPKNGQRLEPMTTVA